MGRKVDLPGGGWANIKDPEELTNRDRKLLRRHAFGAVELGDKLRGLGVKPGTKPQDIPDDLAEQVAKAITPDDWDTLSDSQGAFIVAYTAEWSLDRPLPTMDDVDDLPGPIFDALAVATADLGDGSLEVTVDDQQDPGSPTGPSHA